MLSPSLPSSALAAFGPLGAPELIILAILLAIIIGVVAVVVWAVRRKK